MNKSRDEILALLRSLGVELPRKTKLPDTELDKRLSKVLDCCQYLARVVPSPPLDPTKYPMWNRTINTRDAVRRHNFGEASDEYDSRMRGKDSPFPPLYKDAFMDLRYSLMMIGNYWDNKRDFMIFQDKEEEYGIALRVLEVREFDARTPIFVVVFSQDDPDAPDPHAFTWLSSYICNRHGTTPIQKVTATLQEQQLLLQLLNQNSKRLVPSYKPRRGEGEGPLQLSFLLPVGPLGAKEMGAFNRNDGCSVCGSPAKSKCSRCGAIRYCDAVCQKEDWKIHRPTCTSLMGGTWERLTFQSPHPAQSPLINRFTNVFDDELRAQPLVKTVKISTPQAPPNTHGATPFIVKVQLNTDSAWSVIDAARGRPQNFLMDGTDMLIYDRQRTFEVHALKKFSVTNRDFEVVAKVVKEKGERGLKVFLWAIRTGEWTIDICLDHLPEWQNW